MKERYQHTDQKNRLRIHYMNDYLFERNDAAYYGSASPVLHLLQQKKDLVMAEIGVYRGRSTLAMLEYSDVSKIYLIDPFSREAADSGNLHDFSNQFLDEEQLYKETKSKIDSHPNGNKAIWLREKSNVAVDKISDGELDFIFIDGAHDYDSVLSDIQLYYPKIKPGGIIAGDDFSNQYRHTQNFGVVEAVNTAFWDLGYRDINAYRHQHKPEDYYSAFALIKE